ncbi:TrbC/VirB2 family protein [Sphingopyxis kveilinensis]|uniref:TrbC/VirB2 family protein n=1 Tax=Sphingopyxis kveilinensis TaxID=3114367 RepID=UPI0030D05D5C
MYSFRPTLSDPPAGSPLAEGVAWVEGAALGSTATVVAVIAVAAIGLLMLSGRLDLRRGITVVLGCFILFGAGGIAAGLTGLAGADPRPPATAEPSPSPSQLRPTMPRPSVYDPYAGASVPVSR